MLMKIDKAGFIRHGVRRGFCSSALINIDNLVSDMDDKQFYSILNNKHHVLYQLLPQNALTAAILEL